MENPYAPPESSQKRVFKTPIIVPISVAVVIFIYAGYIFLHSQEEDVGVLLFLKNISFEIFLLCGIGIVTATVYNKKLIDSFLVDCPVISDDESLEKLKPILRTNMYSALFGLFFLVLGSLTSIMTILNHGLAKGIIVAAMSIAATWVIRWYNRSEQKIKDIECVDEALEQEFKSILLCWLNKPLPNF